MQSSLQRSPVRRPLALPSNDFYKVLCDNLIRSLRRMQLIKPQVRVRTWHPRTICAVDVAMINVAGDIGWCRTVQICSRVVINVRDL